MATTKAYEIGDFGVSLNVNSDGEVVSLDLDSDSVTEGSTNLYYTNTRARGAISVSGNLTYDSGTGVLGFTMPTTIASLSNHDTDDLTEGSSNLYFTTARARASVSGSTGITYSSSTGAISLTSGIVTAGTYGDASNVAQVTVDTYGRVTSVSEVAIAGVDNVSYTASTGVLTVETSSGTDYSVDLGIGTGDSPTFQTVTLTGSLDMADNQSVLLGTDDDLTLYHDNSHGYVVNDTGTLFVKADTFSVQNNAGTSTRLTVDSNGTTASGTLVYSTLNDGTTDLTATVAELNTLDGITATVTELNYTDGVTSNIQTQLDTKAPTASPTFTGTVTTSTASLDGAVTINDSGADVDFRVESDTDQYALFVRGSDGYVGIGASSPGRQLTVEGSGVVRVDNNNSGDPGIDFNVDSANKMQIRYRRNTDKFAIYSYGTTSDVVTIDQSDGYVGIGTTSPYNKLHVRNNVNNSGSYLDFGNTDYNGQLKVENQNTTANSWAGLDLRSNTTDFKIACLTDGNSNTGKLAISGEPGGTVAEYITIDNYTGLTEFNYNVNVDAKLEVSGYEAAVSSYDMQYTRHSGNGITVDGRESVIEIIGEDVGDHASSLYIRNANDGFALINNPGDDSLELKSFTATADGFYAHAAGGSISNLYTIATFNRGGGLDVNGAFTATTKSFDIEHPTKEGMRLHHGSLEGPEHGVYVRGKLKDGYVIELPDYWTGLVDEDSITVQVTAIGDKQDIWVENIIDNTVVLGSDTTINCFYFVQAERKDIDKFEVEYIV